MNKLYTNGNYVIAEDSRGVHEYGKAKSVYSVTNNPVGYVIKEAIDVGELTIPTADIGLWFDEAGVVPYTEATLVAFLRENTANFSSGGVSTFEALTDTPSYVGNALKGLRINAAEDALEPYVATDLNQWLMTGVAFVDPVNGDNGTAVVGDGNLPYKTLLAAQNASDYILALAGLYWSPTQGTSTLQILDGKHIHFMLGAVLGGNASIRDFGVSIDSVITGQLVCGGNSYAFTFTGATTKMSIDMEAMETTRQILYADNGADVYLRIKRIRCNNSVGGGYACRPRFGSRITIDVLEYCHIFHWLVLNGGGGGTNYFTINCPDLRVLAVSTYGNQFKALINDQSFAKGICHINVEKFVNEASVQTTAFGILESGLVLYTGGAGSQDSEFHFTGDFDAGVMFGWLDYYAVYQGITTFTNGSLKSDTNPFSSLANAVGPIVIREIFAKNFRFEGGRTGNGFMQFGSGRYIYMVDCQFSNLNPAGIRIWNHNNAIPLAGIPELQLYNCIAELANSGLGDFMTTAGGTPLLKTVNTYSSETLGVTPDTWGGYAQIAGFTIPKF